MPLCGLPSADPGIEIRERREKTITSREANLPKSSIRRGPYLFPIRPTSPFIVNATMCNMKLNTINDFKAKFSNLYKNIVNPIFTIISKNTDYKF